MEREDRNPGLFFRRVTEELEEAVSTSETIIRPSHLRLSLLAMDERKTGVRRDAIMAQMLKSCPKLFDVLMASSLHASQHLEILPEARLASIVIYSEEIEKCGAAFAKIFFPVYFAQQYQWPLIDDDEVEICYWQTNYRYGPRFGFLYSEFIQKLSGAYGEKYKEATKKFIDQLRLSSSQVCVIALLSIVFFELVPCRFQPEEEKPPQ